MGRATTEILRRDSAMCRGPERFIAGISDESGGAGTAAARPETSRGEDHCGWRSAGVRGRSHRAASEQTEACHHQ